MTIVNLTQHAGTPEQGVVDLTGGALAELKSALTFDAIPAPFEIEERAETIARLAVRACLSAEDYWENNPVAVAWALNLRAMIGGAPYLMAPLERALKERGITPLYAFSVRESAEQTLPDGTVRKVNTFRHAGFVPAV